MGSAAWGHELEKAVGLAWVSRVEKGDGVDRRWVEAAAVDWQVDIIGRRRSASVRMLTPLLSPYAIQRRDSG